MSPYRQVFVCVFVCVLDINRSGLNHTQYTYAVANPVLCGLLDRERSKEHLQRKPRREHGNKNKTKTKNSKHMPEKYTPRKEGHSIERVLYTARREPSDTPPGSHYLAFAPKRA